MNKEYRFGFNGQEKDDEWNGQTGSTYDFGARLYDARIGRWMACDPLAVKYPNQSPYNFVANMPIIAIDPDGKDVYIVILTNSDSEYRSAALTRKNEIVTSDTYDNWFFGGKDKVYYLEVTDLGDLEAEIAKVVDEANNYGYGKTIEVSFFGHDKTDGPVGDEEASKYNLADLTGNRGLEGDQNQLTPSGWESIDFNFDKNKSVAAFYGCQSSTFAEKFMYYQPSVKYTVGLGGSAGVGYNYKGSHNPIWLNLFNQDTYMVDQIGGSVCPRFVYNRSIYTHPEYGKLYEGDAEGNIIPKRESTFIYGNVTVDESNSPTSGSD